MPPRKTKSKAKKLRDTKGSLSTSTTPSTNVVDVDENDDDAQRQDQLVASDDATRRGPDRRSSLDDFLNESTRATPAPQSEPTAAELFPDAPNVVDAASGEQQRAATAAAASGGDAIAEAEASNWTDFRCELRAVALVLCWACVRSCACYETSCETNSQRGICSALRRRWSD